MMLVPTFLTGFSPSTHASSLLVSNRRGRYSKCEQRNGTTMLSSMHSVTCRQTLTPSKAAASFYRAFHDYFVTHLPSSSLHPDSRSPSGPHHQLPRSASKPHDPSQGPSPAPLLSGSRDTTVVRIPLRSAKHHFGVSVSRGTRPYNEDTYQAGVIDLPAFAKRSPVNVTRAPASSPLQAYRDGQRRQQGQGQGQGQGQAAKGESGDREATSAEGVGGDPQVFYFGVFDGHGGTECSGYLRAKLHTSIEQTALRYHLESSLKNQDGSMKPSAQVETSDGDPPTSSSSTQKLQDDLMNGWRENVGGYFRRFRPTAFTDPSDTTRSAVSPNIPTVLTHAFLQADLTFLLTQLRLDAASSDATFNDRPLNTDDSPQPSPRPHPSSKPPFKGGSTASVALISTPSPTPFWHPSTPSTLYTAHVGDTRILLCAVSDGRAHSLTTNHHPSHPIESSRLRRYAASFVTDSFGEERMSGLANTRAFGDMRSKGMGVSAEPEIRRIDLQPSEYAFMTIVSDGVSGAVGDQEIVDLVKEARTPEEGARAVVAFATEVGEEGDNATAIVVRLGGWERRSEGGGGSLSTKEGREWRRKEAEEGRGRSGLR